MINAMLLLPRKTSVNSLRVWELKGKLVHYTRVASETYPRYLSAKIL